MTMREAMRRARMNKQTYGCEWVVVRGDTNDGGVLVVTVKGSMGNMPAYLIAPRVCFDTSEWEG